MAAVVPPRRVSQILPRVFSDLHLDTVQPKLIRSTCTIEDAHEQGQVEMEPSLCIASANSVEKF